MEFYNVQMKEYRENIGLTLAQLAAKIGVSFQTLQKWEAGKVTPKPSRVPDIAGALHCSVNDLCNLCVDDIPEIRAPEAVIEKFRLGLIAELVNADIEAESLKIVLRIVSNYKRMA